MSVYVGFKIGKASERKAYISEYYCGACGWPVSDHDSYCPECGGAFRKEDATERTCKPETEVVDTVDIGIGFLEKLVDNCSECGEPLTIEYSINAIWRRVLPNYCPNCGAKVIANEQ